MTQTKFILIVLYCGVFSIDQHIVVNSERVPLVCSEFEHIVLLEQDLLLYEARYDGATPKYESFYCTVKDFHVNYTSQIDCNVYGPSRDSVKVVRFIDSTLLHIPYCMFHYFGSIQEFDISYAGIETIHRNFEGAVALMFLTLSHNNITEIPASVFADAPQLAIIDLSHNQIEKINKFAFANARSISRINLSHNKIKTLEGTVFHDVAFLDQIELNFNQLEEIPKNLFEKNTMVQKIYLSNNKITNISCEVFQFCHYLDELQLESNHLEEFSSVCILKNMELINLNNNKLTKLVLNDVKHILASNNSLKSVEFGNFTSLMRRLVLTNNSLVDVTSILKNLDKLNHLDLSYNYIGKLNISSFAKLKSLKKLYLAHTNLSNINFGTFANQKQLTVLDISYNNLSSINLDMFSASLNDITEFYVDGNSLTELRGHTSLLSTFPSLHLLGISNNNFNCTYLSQLMRTINFGQVTLNIDLEADSLNTTHISGIPCDHISGSMNIIDHDSQSNGNENSQQQDLQSKFNVLYKSSAYHSSIRRNNSKEMHLVQELSSLRSKYADDEAYKQNLEAHLGTMRFLICVICLACLAFVVVKFVKIFTECRRLSYSPDLGVYQSTATMNTLQSSVAY